MICRDEKSADAASRCCPKRHKQNLSILLQNQQMQTSKKQMDKKKSFCPNIQKAQYLFVSIKQIRRLSKQKGSFVASKDPVDKAEMKLKSLLNKYLGARHA
jgi:hypothetical protein